MTKQTALDFSRRSYPETPGYKAEGTSEKAARKVTPIARGMRLVVLEELRKAPGTADEIAKRLKRSVLAIRPRISELACAKEGHKALIEDTGERRENESGLPAVVWRVVE